MPRMTPFSDAAAKGRSAKAGLVVTERFAHDLAPPALRLEQLGSEYAEKLARVGAGVEAQLELMSDATEPLDEETRSELDFKE